MKRPTYVEVSSVLAEVFDRGLRKDEKLTRRERELFLIQDFILSTEMGGLSGFLYNSCSKRGRLDATAKAMEKYEVKPLVPITRELATRFHGWRARSKKAQTWEETQRTCISDARLDVLEYKLTKASDKGYGLERSRILRLVWRSHTSVEAPTIRSGGLSGA